MEDASKNIQFVFHFLSDVRIQCKTMLLTYVSTLCLIL
jgi:hypothetical protein